MKQSIFFSLIILLCLLQQAEGANENWVFLGISSINMSTAYYDSNSIKKDSGIFSGPTAKVNILSVYPDNHPELKSEIGYMQFYCTKKTFLTLKRLQMKKDGGTKKITKQSWVQDVPPGTIADKLFNIVCR